MSTLPGATPWTVRVFGPVVLAATSPLLIALSGLSQRALLATPFEDRFYGFFLDRYPLFAFAIVYGAARIALAAVDRGGGAWRLLTAPLGLALFLLACLHPTFGGVVARVGFATGGVAFLNGMPLTAAFLAGTAAAAFVYGLALGGGIVLARGRIHLRWRAVSGVLFSFAALWWGAAVIAAPQAFGWPAADDWPALPLDGSAALRSAALVAAALLPHALIGIGRDRDIGPAP